MANVATLTQQAARMSRDGVRVEVARDGSYIHAHQIPLPPVRGGAWTAADGRPLRATPMLADLPADFPRHVGGIGAGHPSYAIHVPELRINGRRIEDLHQCRHHPWFWLCFLDIAWRDTYGIHELIELVQGSLVERAEKTIRGR